MSLRAKSVGMPALFALVISILALNARAQVTYTYTGQPLQDCGGTYAPICDQVYERGSFTLPQALAPNLSGYTLTPSTYSFGDGADVTLASGSSYIADFEVSTDGNGDLTSWYIVLDQTGTLDWCAGYNEVLQINGWASGQQGGDSSCYNNPQSWGAGGQPAAAWGVWTCSPHCLGSSTVTITDADLVNNSISATLVGSSGGTPTGVLTFTIQGAVNQFKVTANNGDPLDPGQYAIPIDRPSIPPDVYSSIKATWDVGSKPPTNNFTISPTWNVRGIVQNTVYIKVYESACSGDPTPGYWTFQKKTCKFTPVKLKPQFSSRTNLNGSGETEVGLLVHTNKQANLCHQSYPEGATNLNTYYTISGITGACGNYMQDSDVATYPNPKKVGDPYSCDDQLLYVARKTDKNTSYPNTVEDYCPVCKTHSTGTNDHVDNYIDKHSCDAKSLPEYWEADLGLAGKQVRIPLVNGSPDEAEEETPEKASYQDAEIIVQSKTVRDTLVLSIDSAKLRKEVQLPDTINQITEIRRYANRIIAIGSEDASVSRLLIIDLEHGIILDSFDGFYPAISPDGRFIAYVKFYPPHFVKGTEDHDMLYDVAKSAMENRPSGAPLDDLVNVGVDVYPGGQNKEGDNIGVPADRAHGTVGQFYWGPDSTKLIFADQTRSLTLVLVKVSGSDLTAAPTTLVAPLDRTSVCAPPLSVNGHCDAYLDRVEFENAASKAYFSGRGKKASVHREIVVSDSEFSASAH